MSKKQTYIQTYTHYHRHSGDEMQIQTNNTYFEGKKGKEKKEKKEVKERKKKKGGGRGWGRGKKEKNNNKKQRGEAVEETSMWLHRPQLCLPLAVPVWSTKMCPSVAEVLCVCLAAAAAAAALVMMKMVVAKTVIMIVVMW